MPRRIATTALLIFCTTPAPAHAQFDDNESLRLLRETEQLRLDATRRARAALQRLPADPAALEEQRNDAIAPPDGRDTAEAWRLRADTLVAQGKLDEAETALLAAIAAHPAQRPSWQRLNHLRVNRGGTPLARLDMKPLVRVTERDGKLDAAVNFSALRPGAEGSDLAVALAQANAAIALHNRTTARTTAGLTAGLTAGTTGGAMAHQTTEQTARQAAGQSPPDLLPSPFQVELQSWRTAFDAADALAAQSGKQLQYPAMRKLQRFHHANQLDAAILLLQFKEAYRPDLEAWLASRPHAVREFVAIWSMQP